MCKGDFLPHEELEIDPALLDLRLIFDLLSVCGVVIISRNGCCSGPPIYQRENEYGQQPWNMSDSVVMWDYCIFAVHDSPLSTQWETMGFHSPPAG